MKLRSVYVENFKIFQHLEIKNLLDFHVFEGEIGSGRNTLVQLFSFLKFAAKQDVSFALQALGGKESVITKGGGPFLKIKLIFDTNKNEKISYLLEVDTASKDKPFVIREEIYILTTKREIPFLVRKEEVCNLFLQKNDSEEEEFVIRKQVNDLQSLAVSTFSYYTDYLWNEERIFQKIDSFLKNTTLYSPNEVFLEPQVSTTYKSSVLKNLQQIKEELFEIFPFIKDFKVKTIKKPKNSQKKSYYFEFEILSGDEIFTFKETEVAQSILESIYWLHFLNSERPASISFMYLDKINRLMLEKIRKSKNQIFLITETDGIGFEMLKGNISWDSFRQKKWRGTVMSRGDDGYTDLSPLEVGVIK